MNSRRWQGLFAAGLVLASALLYGLHYTLFRSTEHIFVFTLGDIAFLPIEVLFVTLIIHRVLEEREKRGRLEKMNMVVGAFFSEVGTDLLRFFAAHDPLVERMRDLLIVADDWSDKQFRSAGAGSRQHAFTIDADRLDLDALRGLLRDQRDFLLRLLENPNLLEHESFTELLFAVFHLAEELQSRVDLERLPATDRAHLANDASRAYRLLAGRWIDYMGHLKGNYPYLFSLAMRTNPFDAGASPIIT